MKVNANDFGICGVEQLFYAGTVAYDDTDIDKGVALKKLPNNIIITRAVAVVNTAFDAGGTNVLTLGTNDDCDNILGSADITEGTTGAYSKQVFVQAATKAEIKAKYTQTGTDATAGEADIYVFFVSIPD